MLRSARRPTRPVLLGLAALVVLVVVLAVVLSGGGGDGDDASAGGGGPLPTVTQNERVSAPDRPTANALCRRYQERRPERVTQLRIRIPGGESVPCIVQ
jgi:hypothetical protein